MAVIASLGGVVVGENPSRAAKQKPQRHPAEIFIAELMKMSLHDQQSAITSISAKNILSERSRIKQEMRIEEGIRRLDEEVDKARKSAEAREIRINNRASDRLKSPCDCEQCRQSHRWPRYYLGAAILLATGRKLTLSYECGSACERQRVDPDILRQEETRGRIGSAFEHAKRFARGRLGQQAYRE